MDRKIFKECLDSLYSVTRHFSDSVILEWMAEGGESVAKLHRIAAKCKTKRNEILLRWDNSSVQGRKEIEDKLVLDESVFNDA